MRTLMDKHGQTMKKNMGKVMEHGEKRMETCWNMVET